MQSKRANPNSFFTRNWIRTGRCHLIVMLLLALNGCDSQNSSDQSGSTGTSQSTSGTTSTGTEGSSDTGDEQRHGDDYWAELAQSYPAYVKDPELGAAYSETDWVNVGSWDAVFDWPLIATGAANMPDGRIAAWSSQQLDAFGGREEKTFGTIWNPLTDTFTPTPNSTHDMFCAGVSMLEDGRVFIAGGGKTVTATSIFSNEKFNEIESMYLSRWYPTSTTLASGQVLTSLGTVAAPYSELWTDGYGWDLMEDISLQTILDRTDVYFRDWYPALNVTPDGTLFHPGHMPEMLSVDLSEHNHSVQSHGNRLEEEMSRLYNTTVMYDVGKMLVAGGGEGATTNTAMTIDLNGKTPIVTEITPMKHARAMQNTVVLPNGEVLVIGGNTSGVQFSDQGTVLEPEIWNPDSQQWRVMDFHDKPRNYHSIAILLKDARVLAAGGGLCGGLCNTNHQDGEVFSPPYLFDEKGQLRARPTISAGDTTAYAGDTISVSGSNNITRFTMLRLVALTHHHTTDQRFVPVDFTPLGNGQYTLNLHSNPNVLIPGYYWVFALDANGTPSHGHTLQIKVSPENTPIVASSNNNVVEYEYFESSWPTWALPDFDTLTPVATGTQRDFSLKNKQRNYNYAFRFKSAISIPEDGNYTFYLSSDDGSKLYIDGKLVVNHDGAHALILEGQGQVELKAGDHEIAVEFFEISGGDALLVSWSGPKLTKRPIINDDLVALHSTTDQSDTTPSTAEANPGSVHYDYFEGVWTSLPNFSNLTPKVTGISDGFDLAIKQRNDFFGVRFSSTLSIATAGNYTFYIHSDDGSRLSIAGKTVVTNDGRHAPQTKQGNVYLTAGEHELQLDYFEYAGGETLTLEWQGPDIERQSLPASVIRTVTEAETDTGDSTSTDDAAPVSYSYYEGVWKTLPNFSALIPNKQGSTNGFSLDERAVNDYFAFTYSATLTVPMAGDYTFYARSDDGSKVYIDGVLVVNNDGLHAPLEKQGAIKLSSGEHTIAVQFFERTGGEILEISWSGPNLTKQLIPLSALSSNTSTSVSTDNTQLHYEYYEGQWSTLPDFDSLTALRDGYTDTLSLPDSNGVLNYGYRLKGHISVESSDVYTFYVNSNDGSQLFIDGVLIVDNNGRHAAIEKSGSVSLTAGQHSIELLYFQSGGSEALEVQWSSSKFAKRAITASELSAP